MLVIRLQRVGRRNDPSFRVVLIDSKRSPKSGAFIEILGSYEPKRKKIQLKNEQIMQWIGKGAKLSDTVHNLLVGANLLSAPKINVVPIKKAKPENEAIAQADDATK